MDSVPKPDELLALHGVTTEMFAILKRWFDVPDSVSLDLSAIDAATREMADPQMIAALAMRKLQALHLISTPGVRTSSDVIVTIVQDLERALVQAPAMWLKRAASATDWDAELAALAGSDPATDLADAPQSATDDDAEVARFRTLHIALHDAVRAVIEVCDGEIRYLE